ncbi:MAG: LysR substrate-binding domain-containing protein [Nocardioidaceae bacterium]
MPFRLAFVPGVTPDKWRRIWEQRVPGVPLELTAIAVEDQLAVLHEGRADMCFVRLPVEREGLSLIPLYVEVPVVVVPREHVVTAFEEVSVADLADEHLLQDPDTVPEWRDIATEVRDGTRADVPPMTAKETFETIGAGTGMVIVPMSVARLHHRKDVAHRPVTDVAESQIGLAWLTEATDTRVETFIGIVRGRTERSSRGGDDSSPRKKPAPTPSGPVPKRQAQRSGTGRGGRRRGRR